ncbi:MAG: tRNA lysidine(34) synthetase TilS [Alphaproteobacteria bacterium]|nr:tRNA lysidine(34) synthetase TilS [Alphaproteobacteria bacterium]
MQVADASASFDLTAIFANLQSVDRIALAVSGGSDSMAMLHLAVDWARLKQKHLFVLTVDHGLRGAAAEEVATVARWSADLDVPHVTLKWLGEKPKTGIQAKARAARYNLMVQWCVAHDVPVLLTAHTADDQAETVVMRQHRTDSAKSLAGIWPELDWQGVRVVRPLLALCRAQLRDYLLDHSVKWIEDPSNDDAKYERVRVRKALAGNSAAGQLAYHAQKQVQDARDAASAWLKVAVKIETVGLIEFSVPDFRGLSALVQDDVLVLLMRMSGSGSMPELSQRQALVAWFQAKGSPRRCLGGVMFAKRSDRILVGREVYRIALDSVPIPACGKLVWDGRFLIQGPVGARVKAAGPQPTVRKVSNLPAFIQSGLPVVTFETGETVHPYQRRVLACDALVACDFIGLNHVAKSWNYKPDTLC